MAVVLPISCSTAAKLFYPLDDSGSRTAMRLKHLSGCSRSFLLMNERGAYPLLLTRFQELDSLNSLLHFFKIFLERKIRTLFGPLFFKMDLATKTNVEEGPIDVLIQITEPMDTRKIRQEELVKRIEQLRKLDSPR